MSTKVYLNQISQLVTTTANILLRLLTHLGAPPYLPKKKQRLKRRQTPRPKLKKKGKRERQKRRRQTRPQ